MNDRELAESATAGNVAEKRIVPTVAAQAISSELADGLPVPRRYWAMTAMWFALAMSVLDTSIANIALPAIAGDLSASAAQSIWVVNAYHIAIAMVLLPIATLGEIAGYRRIYISGLALFVAASLACGLAPSLTGLAVARFVQGLGAASTMAISGALLRVIYPKARMGRGISYNVLIVAICSAAGPSLAAAILALGSWRWLFAINIPLGLVACILAYYYLPSAEGATKRFDYLSAILNCSAFGALFLALSDAAQGTMSTLTVVELALGVASGVLLIHRSWAAGDPMVPLDLLRIPILRLSYSTSSCAFAAQMILMVSLPFYLQGHFGFNEVSTGLLITPMPVGIAIAAPIAGRLVERIPAGLLGGVGLFVVAGGLCLLVLTPIRSPLLLLIVAMVTCGLGFGLFQSPNSRTMLGVAPIRRSGAAAGMLATARLVGQTVGAVLVALLFRSFGDAHVAPVLFAAALSVVAALLSLRRLRLASDPHFASGGDRI
ncbi:MFS transporter [Sphingopyxis sp. SE2]|uniref:MFS transporter n=1 Tax=Sphingopyxis sp. SE2 TaxID=1586240 RepID=UPI0028C16B59|nr:MFS transporter [Sphingopyxis sp. SE2]MDT7531703.1 MFS transporter [Sphingopyxis sp. SE2]